VRTYTATVIERRELTHDVRELDLRLDDPPSMSFLAGQFVSFEIPQPGRRFGLTRPYSIASPPQRNDAITLLFNLVPNGPGSSYLDALRPGDSTSFRGPAGTFVIRYDDGATHLLFVATGTGIAPFKSMIYDWLSEPRESRATLVWGLRAERDLYYCRELNDLAREHPRFRWIVTLSRPSPSWNGRVGRVQPVVEELVKTTDGLAAYLCGNSAMIRDVSDTIKRIGRCPVYREQWYRD